MHEHGPFEKHRLPQRLEQIGKYQECFALKLSQYTQLALPAALAQLGLRQNYSLARRIAPLGKDERISLLARQHEHENFRLSAHQRDTG
ncbi:MAG: hypothetical protein AUI53_05580 [Acidobacteria bacterium 13_1_40CM_2_60_7]|nr:MAG: hypothetical protein AUI53_05580 [Acidobacteria bacterium 13_1_40CM_2_60_7]